MIRCLIFVLVLGFSFVTFGQSEPILTNYSFNKLYYNPAATGIDDGICANFIYRNMWDKFPGAPNSTIFNLDANLSKVFYGSYGLVLMNDVYGDFSRNNLTLNSSFPFQIKEFGYLNIGIGLSLVNLSLNTNWITPSGSLNDPTLPKNGSGSSLYGNFGMTWKSFKGYYFGISSTLINNPEVRTINFKYNRHFFFLAGHRFKNLIGQNKDLEIQTLAGTNLIIQNIDFNLKYYHSNLFYTGVGFRGKKSMNLQVGFYPLKNFTLGYSYDILLNGIKKGAIGTHEIVARYRYVIPEPPLERTKHPRWL